MSTLHSGKPLETGASTRRRSAAICDAAPARGGLVSGQVTSSGRPALAIALGIAILGSLLLGAAGYGLLEGPNGLAQKIGRLVLYLAPLPTVMALTLAFPARAEQRLLSSSLAQDALYFALMIAYRILFTAVVVTALHGLYAAHLDFLTLRIGDGLPLWARVLMAVTVGDLLGWTHHYIRHRVPLFWHFHAVHHSQREMSYLTDLRVHVLDYAIAQLIVMLPTFMLEMNAPTVFLISLAIQWHTLTYHSNIRTNYGPLRYLLVTPQSHRIHHSTRPEHYDSNFGAIFSVWDRLLGTQHPATHSYPSTGVDEDFPVERSIRDVISLRPLLAQFIEPFRRALHRSTAP